LAEGVGEGHHNLQEQLQQEGRHSHDAHKLRDDYKEKWAKKVYVTGAQVDSAEAKKKKKPPRSRRSRNTKKSTK
jgi:hypothetical protein